MVSSNMFAEFFHFSAQEKLTASKLQELISQNIIDAISNIPMCLDMRAYPKLNLKKYDEKCGVHGAGLKAILDLRKEKNIPIDCSAFALPVVNTRNESSVSP